MCTPRARTIAALLTEIAIIPPHSVGVQGGRDQPYLAASAQHRRNSQRERRRCVRARSPGIASTLFVSLPTVVAVAAALAAAAANQPDLATPPICCFVNTPPQAQIHLTRSRTTLTTRKHIALLCLALLDLALPCLALLCLAWPCLALPCVGGFGLVGSSVDEQAGDAVPGRRRDYCRRRLGLPVRLAVLRSRRRLGPAQQVSIAVKKNLLRKLHKFVPRSPVPVK